MATGPQCLSSEVTAGILARREQFEQSPVGRNILKAAAQRELQLRTPAPATSQIGEVDSLAKLFMEARQEVMQIWKEADEVDCILGYIKQLAEFVTPRHTAI